MPPSVTSLCTCVWNWSQCITYLNATPFVWNQMKVVLISIVACRVFDWQNFGVSTIKFDYRTQSKSIERLKFDWDRLPNVRLTSRVCITGHWDFLPPGGVLPYITYTGMWLPKGSLFWSSWFRTGYPFQRRFLERGIIFRTHESSIFVGSHLKVFKDSLLLKIRFNALTSKLLYSCCTLCSSVQGGRILARAASADLRHLG